MYNIEKHLYKRQLDLVDMGTPLKPIDEIYLNLYDTDNLRMPLLLRKYIKTF